MKLVILISLFILGSCGARGPLHFEAPGKMENEVRFSTISTNILETKCNSCHKNFVNEDNLLKFIDDTSDPDKSKLFEVVKNGSMPKKAAPLSSLELEMVRAYILGVDPVKTMSFTELKTDLLDAKCLNCHKKAVDEQVFLQKWVNVESPMDSKLLASVTSGKMPKDAKHLTREEINLIKGYLKTIRKPKPARI